MIRPLLLACSILAAGLPTGPARSETDSRFQPTVARILSGEPKLRKDKAFMACVRRAESVYDGASAIYPVGDGRPDVKALYSFQQCLLSSGP